MGWTLTLMDDVLTLNGVSLGWSVDWGLTEWVVPVRVFAHPGTWIEALAAIAGAAGGELLPHPTDKNLRVPHRYPVAPWEWHTVTPGFVLPDPPSQAGTVIDVGAGAVTVELPGGGRVRVCGSTAIGQPVFVRDGVVETLAPNLPIEVIEI